MGRRGGKRRRRNRKEHQTETSSCDGNDNGSKNCNIPKKDNGIEDNVDDESSRINNNKRSRYDDKKNDDNNNDESVRSNVQPKIQVTYHDGGGGEENKGNDKIVQLPQPIRTLQQDSDDIIIDCSDETEEKKANQTNDNDFLTLYSQIWKYLSSSPKRNNNSSNQLLMTNPTLIQQHLWSIMMEMYFSSNGSFDSACTTTTKSTTTYNTIGIAPTGSGKTLAYGLPTIISKQNVLVLVPTRELVQQVGSVYQKLSKAYRKVQQKKQQNQQQQPQQHRVLMIYGGTNDRFKQRQELFCKNKTNLITTIVVATPGRLLDLLSSSSPSPPPNADNNNDHHHLSTTSTSSTSLLFQPGWIILDEADQLAKEGDLGPQVDQILEKVGVSSSSSSSATTTNHRPKIALVSATYPQKAHTMFQKWVGKEYVLVEIDPIATTTNTHTTTSSSRKRKLKNDEEDHNNDDDRVVRSDGEEAFAASGTEESLSGEATNNSNQKLSLLSSRIPSNLNQILHVCSEHKKPKKLIHTLKTIIYNNNKNNGDSKEPSSRSRPLGIVFFSRIEKVKYVSKLLDKERIPNIQLHSQLNTQQRQFNLKSFSCGKYPLLLATDLAARGIDIPSIKFIIQYDFPSNIQQYIHRCGRAGRRSLNNHPNNKNINKINNNDKEIEETTTATVYSFFTRNLKPMAPDMIKLLEANNAWVDPNLRTLVTNGNEDHQNTSNKKKQKKGITGKHSKNEKSSIGTKEQQPSKPKNVAASNNPTLLSNDKINDGNLLDDDDDDDFKDLAPNRIILKRASHVSDASSSSSDSDDG